MEICNSLVPQVRGDAERRAGSLDVERISPPFTAKVRFL